MASHLIFIARENLVGLTTAEQLEAVGLADHAHGARTVQSDGPEELGGTLYGWDLHATGRMHFKAEEQTWIPAAVSGDLAAKRYWVGVWNDSPPTPKDLVRPYPFDGPKVRLADGLEWRVPRPKDLPQMAKLNDDGTWRFEVQRKFSAYYDEAVDWISRVARSDSDEEVPITLVEMLSVSTRALRLNYRLTPELIEHLELFDQLAAARCFTTALGLELKE